jgi:hypothetical protein
MTDNRSPRIWARVPPDEHQRVEDAAKKHYDGNLSMLVRIAVQKWIIQLDSVRAEDAPKEQAAA